MAFEICHIYGIYAKGKRPKKPAQAWEAIDSRGNYGPSLILGLCLVVVCIHLGWDSDDNDFLLRIRG